MLTLLNLLFTLMSDQSDQMIVMNWVFLMKYGVWQNPAGPRILTTDQSLVLFVTKSHI